MDTSRVHLIKNLIMRVMLIKEAYTCNKLYAVASWLEVPACVKKMYTFSTPEFNRIKFREDQRRLLKCILTKEMESLIRQNIFRGILDREYD